MPSHTTTLNQRAYTTTLFRVTEVVPMERFPPRNALVRNSRCFQMLHHQRVDILGCIFPVDAIDMAVACNHVPLVQALAVRLTQEIERDFGTLRQETLVR